MVDISTSIPVLTGSNDGRHAGYVDARSLWVFLGVGRQFGSWIVGRIQEYGFVEGEDFLISQIREIKNAKGRGGDRRSREYKLTLDTAKELSMVERTDAGRVARRYFIECERRLHRIAPTEPAAAMREVISRSQFGDLRRDIHEIARLVKGRTYRSVCHSLYKGLHEKLGVATCAEIAVDQLDIAQEWLADRRAEWEVADGDRKYTLDDCLIMLHDWYLGGRQPERVEVELSREVLMATRSAIKEAKLQMSVVQPSDRAQRANLRAARNLLSRNSLATALPAWYRSVNCREVTA